MTTKFGIIGYGYVGKATHYSILKDQKCSVHDIIFNTSREDLKDSDYVFICIPTSSQKDLDLLSIELKSLIDINPDVQIIIRSTVPLGTCKQIEQEIGKKVIYIPEFLRERFWQEDSLKRPLIVGHNGVDIPDWLKQETIIECSTEEAELTKMFSNNFAVMRIAFANVFYDLSQKVAADYNLIKDMYFQVAHDQTYMEVPGHDGTRGFGGKCLPKDLDFIIDTLDKNEINQNWFKHIRELNNGWQKKF